MPIVFKRHRTGDRLLVGYRKRDWKQVWYVPVDDEDEDGGRPIGLYKHLTMTGTREPMMGEVCWLPHFDPKTLDSTSSAEREKIQKQFLSDLHKYMSEKDPIALAALEEALDDPDHRRWQSIFDEAKKMKKKDVKARGKKRKEREDIARSVEDADGVDFDKINSDDSEDTDSGLDMDEPQTSRMSAPTKRNRPPPTQGKRKAPPYVGSARNKPEPKKPKTASSRETDRTARYAPSHSQSDRTPSTRASTPIYDDTDPTKRDMPPPSAPGTWGFGGMRTPTPTQTKHRGNSRSPDENGDGLFMTGANGGAHGDANDDADDERDEKSPATQNNTGAAQVDPAIYNGDTQETEEEIVERVMRDSVPPESRRSEAP